MKQDHATPRQGMFARMAAYLATVASLQGPGALEIMGRAMHRNVSHGGRMAFASDFRRVHLRRIKFGRGTRS